MNKWTLIGAFVVGSTAMFVIGMYIAEYSSDPAFAICDQLDKYPLTSSERKVLHEKILQDYGVRCP